MQSSWKHVSLLMGHMAEWVNGFHLVLLSVSVITGVSLYCKENNSLLFHVLLYFYPMGFYRGSHLFSVIISHSFIQRKKIHERQFLCVKFSDGFNQWNNQSDEISTHGSGYICLTCFSHVPIWLRTGWTLQTAFQSFPMQLLQHNLLVVSHLSLLDHSVYIIIIYTSSLLYDRLSVLVLLRCCG